VSKNNLKFCLDLRLIKTVIARSKVYQLNYSHPPGFDVDEKDRHFDIAFS
jgi:hypothetical protein